jgi:hypothetical protein
MFFNFIPFDKRAPPNTRTQSAGGNACTQAMEVEPHLLGQVPQRETERASPGIRARRPPKVKPPSAAPLTRRFVGFEIILLPKKLIWTVQTDPPKVMLVNTVSRSDHGQITISAAFHRRRSLASLTRVRIRRPGVSL